MKKQFQELIQGFCTLSDLQNPERVLADGAVVVNDITFSLVYNEQANPKRVFIYSDFGDVPKGKEIAAYRALLKANLLLYNGTGPTFSLSIETGRVVFIDYCKLADTTPKNLLDHLIRLAEKAMEWRSTYFLEMNEVPSASTILKNRLPLTNRR